MTGERLASILQQTRIQIPTSNFLFGTVKTINPISVTVNDLPTLTEEMLVLGKNVIDYETEITINWTSEPHTHFHYMEENTDSRTDYRTHSHGITGRKKTIIHNALKVGDKVFLIRSNDGQKFYIAERMS
jgi:Protein of unknown function (DUF2577).